MVPAISTGGRSFKAAGLYFLHDKPQPGQQQRTATRVAWTRIANLPTDDPHRAWRMMARTAEDQAALKKAAGIKASGRKLRRPTFAYSLAWHPDETPTEQDMADAALASLQALGLDEHQAVIVAHNDTAHAHLHILCNRVHPHTGVAAKLAKSKLVLSAWAQAYEEAHGLIRCAARVENNARRAGTRPGRAADNRKPRLIRPAFAAGGSRRPATAHLATDHAERFSAQAGMERQGERSRVRETADLHQQRRQARAAIRGRHLADPRLTALVGAGDPATILDELTRQQATFTWDELVRLIGRHAPDEVTFRAVLQAIEASAVLIGLGRDDRGRLRFTSRSHQAIEQRMDDHARALAGRMREGGAIPAQWAGMGLSADQDQALRHVLAAPALAAVVGFAGSGKSTLLAAARASWEAAGYRVHGAALSGIAADGLKTGAGIDSRTVHSRLFQWDQGQGLLTPRDVLVIDEAGMIGSHQMERVLGFARKAGAKVVLVGDPEQLQAIDAGAAFRAIVARVGAAELKTVRRQKAGWQQDATRELATGHTAAALQRYEAAGMLHAHARADDAQAAIVDAWSQARAERPGHSQIILAFTRKEVRALNDLARARMRAAGQLGPDHVLPLEGGSRTFAAGDRAYFLRSDTRLGVRNGSLGTIERIHGKIVTVRLDGKDGKRLTFSTADYAHLDHGYATTIHKSQGVTVDRTHVLAGRGFNRHLAYVALTRHRDRVDVHWSSDQIGSRAQLDRIMARHAAKDTSLDYAALQAEARAEASDDMGTRIERRAAAYDAREATASGRMKNARSLLESGASLIEIARLSLNERARKLLFQRRQAVLRRWARRLGQSDPDAKARATGSATAMADQRAALIAHGQAARHQADAMRARHAGEIREELTVRRSLQRAAGRGWASEIEAARARPRPPVGVRVPANDSRISEQPIPPKPGGPALR